MIVLALALALFAGQTPEARVKELRALYEKTNARVKRLTPTYHCGGELAWKQVTRAGLEDEECWESAEHYVDAGRPLKTVLVLATPSGDWQSRVELYFDDAGRTAFRFEQLSTFYGGNETLTAPFRVETRTYYARDGKVVRELVSAVQTTTGKKVSPEVVYQQKTPRPLRAAELEFLPPPDAGN